MSPASDPGSVRRAPWTHLLSPYSSPVHLLSRGAEAASAPTGTASRRWDSQPILGDWTQDINCFLDVGRINQVTLCILQPLQRSVVARLISWLIFSNLVWKPRMFCLSRRLLGEIFRKHSCAWGCVWQKGLPPSFNPHHLALWPLPPSRVCGAAWNRSGFWRDR